MKKYESPNYNGRQFINPVPTTVSKPGTSVDIFRQFVFGKEQRTPKPKLQKFKTDVAKLRQVPGSGIRVTWFGHSSVLFEVDGKRFLTDPVWSKYSSPVPGFGPARFFPPTIALNQLPKLDGIIISHDHYDHFDPDTLKILSRTGVKFYIPIGVDEHFRKWGVPENQLVVCDWADEVILPDGFKLICAPARHFSGRGLFNRNSTLWASWVILTEKHRIYYGGDSGYFEGFKTLGEKYGPFDLTMLEIGAYHENWADIHMGPENALQAHQDLKGEIFLPIHWGLFNLAFHAWDEPVETLLKLSEGTNVKILLPTPGEPTLVTNEGFNSGWWKIKA